MKTPRVWIKRAALSLMAAALLNAAASAGAQTTIQGKWDYEDQFQKILAIFNPDGRYFLSFDYGNDAPVQEYGYYTREGDQVKFRTRTKENVSTFTLITDGLMTLNGGAFFGQTFKFDTQYDMAADWKTYDDREAVLDEKWRNYLTIKTMGVQPPHVPVGDVPADPDLTRIFSDPVVFDPQRLYTYLNAPKTLTFSNGETRTVRNKEDFHLLATGRAYVRFLNYFPGGSVDGKVTEFWGRYTITPGARNDLYYGIVDALRIETDAGEVVLTELHDGRRMLHWMAQNGLYGEVDWENAVLAGKTDPPTGTEPPTFKKGDVSADGGVDVTDAILILRSIVGAVTLDAGQAGRADLNGDSLVDVQDAVKVLLITVGLENPPE